MTTETDTDLLSDIVDTGFSLGTRVVSSVLGLRRPSRLPFQLSRQCGSCGCHIPPPCWEPESLGDFTTRECPAETAKLRISVTNCGSSSRTIQLSFGKPGPDRSISPASMALGAFEREYAVASLEVPAAAETGDVIESLVWIDGCRQHYLRWRIRVGESRFERCPTVEVEDCPDLIHHWYDHFYCERPCPPHRRHP